jgi:hypothetical protein
LSDDPYLPFGHNTLKIRAVFIPDGAQVSMSDITRVVGFDPVFIRAVWVPPGGAMPGYPYEHIGEAVFIPDRDGRDTPASIHGQSPARMSPWRATSLPAPSRTEASRAQEDNALDDRRWPGSPVAGTAGPWAPATDPAGGNTSSSGSAPRRGVRSTQANFSAAVPTPHLDTLHDAIDAALNALSLRPANWDYASAASSAASATGSVTSLPPAQFPADLIGAATADPMGRSHARSIRLVSDPSATLAALDGVSASNPIIQSLARSGRRRHSNDGIHLAAGATRDLIGDEVKGGRTIQTHVEKARSISSIGWTGNRYWKRHLHIETCLRRRK